MRMMKKRMFFKISLVVVIVSTVGSWYLVLKSNKSNGIEDIKKVVKNKVPVAEETIIKTSKEYPETGFKKQPSLRQNGGAKFGSDNIGKAKRNHITSTDKHKSKRIIDDKVHLAVVACGKERVAEVLMMLKSAVLLTQRFVHIHFVTEDESRAHIESKISNWPENILKKLQYTLHSVSFPVPNPEEWKKLFKPCATQRIFLPKILNDVDSAIYVDTDVLFLTPIEKVWDHFKKFNSTQFAALTPEGEDPNAGWYNRFARHPYYGPFGVNTGVMLMNLTRMEEFNWVEKLVSIYEKYKLKLTWGDQDLINILFHYHPDKLYIYNCEYNYRTDHCMYMSNCQTAEENGVMVLHGSRRVFENDKQPTFKAVNEAFIEYDFKDSLYDGLLLKMKKKLSVLKGSPCSKVSSIFYKELEKNIEIPNLKMEAADTLDRKEKIDKRSAMSRNKFDKKEIGKV